MDYNDYSENLRVEVNDTIMTLTLDNPPMNCNTAGLHTALTKIWEDIHDDEGVNVVIFTGKGRAFSAGGDINAMQNSVDNPDLWWKTFYEAKRIVFRMLECDKPIIARINGHAMGFGATLALACDIIIAVDTAKIGDPHVSAGLVAGDGGSLLWPQAIGLPRAKEALLLGDPILAPRAAEIGLINYAVPADELDARVDEIAGRLRHGAARAIRWTKQTMNMQVRQSAQGTMDLGMALETLSHFSDDHAEAVRSFSEKRDPKFSGK